MYTRGMQEPAFKPTQWIIFKQDDGGGFGRIVGGTFNGESWIYSVRGPITDTTYAEVGEEEITHFYENGSWLEPHNAGMGKASAYTEQS